MTLLLQAGAFIVVALLFCVFAENRVARASLMAALGLTTTALAYFIFWTHVWSVGQTFTQDRKTWAAIGPGPAAVYGASALGSVDVAYAEWAHARIGAGESFYLAQPQPRDEAVYQWVTYRMLPNLAVDDPAKADWLLYYDAAPKHGRYDGVVVESLQKYSPGRGMARVQHAS